jgi:hypothetical protein
MKAILELIVCCAAFIGMSYCHYNQKDGIILSEDTRYQKWTKLKKHTVDAGLKVFYSGLIMFALLPSIYGADWPERYWC